MRSARRSLVSEVAALLVVAVTVALAPALVGPLSGTGTATAGMRVSTTKVVRYVGDLGNVQPELDRCRGPVAWNSRGEGARWLVFEHDFCGGAWAVTTRTGDRLQIRNGVLRGGWRANGKVKVVTQGALVSTTRGLGRLVVQTCIPGTSKMRLVGFRRAR